MSSLHIYLFATLIVPADVNTNFFGNFNRRHAAAVAVDLRAAAHLPTEAFDQIAPSVLEIARDARPSNLKVVALDVYTSCCGDGAAGVLMDYFNQCLDAAAADVPPVGRETFDRVWMVEAFVMSDFTTWSPALRRSPATRAILTRIANWRLHLFDDSAGSSAVENLMLVLPDDTARRFAALDFVRTQAPGVFVDSFDLRLVSDPASMQTLRDIASQPGYNQVAVRILSYLGDVNTLPILQQKRADSSPANASWLPERVEENIQRINMQTPPSALIAYLRNVTTNNALSQCFAIQRAIELGLDRSQIQSALAYWESHWTGYPLYVVRMHEFASSKGLMDLAGHPSSAPAAFDGRIGFLGGPPRRTGVIEIPDRRPKQSRWKPNDANWPRFIEWDRSQNWRGVTDAEFLGRLKAKLCELDLLSPDACEKLAASQPSG